MGGEPKIGVAGRCAKNKGLGETDNKGTSHSVRVLAAGTVLGAYISDPVAKEHQHGGGKNGNPRGSMEANDSGDSGNHKGEEEGNADPVDVIIGDAIELGRLGGNGSVR